MKSEIQKLTNHLIENGFGYEGKYDSSPIYFAKVYGDVRWFVALTDPHSGNKFRWLLRAENEIEFDRWHNAGFQGFYNDVDDFIKNAVCQLEEYIKNAIIEG